MKWPWQKKQQQPLSAPEKPTGVFVMVDGVRQELEPRYVGYQKGEHLWEVQVPKGIFDSFGATSIPPYTGIQWLLPGLAPWRPDL